MPRGDNYGAYKPEFVKQAQKLAKLGARNIDLADFFEIDVRTITKWQVKYPEFAKALALGKKVADDAVEKSLYQLATGYSHDAVKIFCHEGMVVEAPYVEHHAPNATACIFWLKNRKPDEWRDKTDHELTGKNGAPLVPVLNVTIDGVSQKLSGATSGDKPKPSS